jgi:cytochrome c-type biogenesis protein CcmF
MIPEFGLYALILAICLAVTQSIVGLSVTRETAESRIYWVKSTMIGQAVMVSLAFAALAYAFIQNDFSVLYVANHSNNELPLLYRFCAIWGGHEGSFLLWLLILCGWGVAIACAKTTWPATLHSRLLAVMGLLSTGFLLFILLASNPFERLLPFPPANGKDLNPLLQDFGLAIHPPMLYLGYVGFSVAFAFAIATLLEGQLQQIWVRSIRPWVNMAWLFLTIGIALGSWWAYYELGWGGWWFWDPVENASLMPWLTGTALIHSLAVTEKRNLFKSWTTLLAIFTFSLSLLGTFLVRSGVLTSVHAFANDPERGLFILCLLGIIVGGSLLLFAWRGHRLTESMDFSLFSRESFLLLNNLLLVVICATILLGTLYPLILDTFNLGKISVGPPYFNTLFVPIGCLLIVFMSIGPMLKWKATEAKVIINQLKWPLIASVVTLLLAIRFLETRDIAVFVGICLALFLMVSVIQDAIKRIRDSNTKWYKMSRGFWGMSIAHFGVAVTLLGITITSAFSIERDVRMKVGDSVIVGGYFFTLSQVASHSGPNYDSFIGQFSVVKNDQAIASLYPERRIYRSENRPFTETAIDINPWRDLYVALSEQLDTNDWAVRIYYKPFVRWIWFGAILMALGGLVGASDRRYRKAEAKVTITETATQVSA